MYTIVICLFFLIVLLAFPNQVIEGSHQGLLLWYQNILPLLLPYMIITNVLITNNSLDNLHFPFKTLHKPLNVYPIVAIILGILCGYPMGAKIVNNMYSSGKLSTSTSKLLLPLCNNASIMFIIGYVYNSILKKYDISITRLATIYIASIVYGLFSYAFSVSSKNKFSLTCSSYASTDNTNLLTTCINDSINTIFNIGVIIMLFSIINAIFYHVSNSLVIKYLCASLEITSGLQIIHNSIFSEDIKIALILALTSLGGISSIFQTKIVLTNKELSIYSYICSKIVIASIVYALNIILY